MLVSWNWLADYVPLPKSLDALTERLMMAGLNHEGVEQSAPTPRSISK